MLRRFFFMLLVFFVGIRFRITAKTPEHIEYDELTLSADKGSNVTFRFYKCEQYYDRYRFGRLTRRHFTQYGIIPRFESNHPDLMERYNDIMVAFMLPKPSWLSDRSISKLILDIYVDHVFGQMKKFYAEKERELFEHGHPMRRRSDQRQSKDSTDPA